jgi:hypothetical protein
LVDEEPARAMELVNGVPLTRFCAGGLTAGYVD